VGFLFEEQRWLPLAHRLWRNNRRARKTAYIRIIRLGGFVLDAYKNQQARREWPKRRIGAALVFLGLLAFASYARATMTPQLAAEWSEVYPKGIPDNVRSWFKSVRSPNGVPCCDVSDGHYTTYDIRNDGYWVPIEGEWRKVPPESIVHNAGNPVGEAIVWYVRQGADTYYIRCFVPGGGV